MIVDAKLDAEGLGDRFEEHRKRPVLEHVDAFERYLASKNDTAKQVALKTGRIRKIVSECRFLFLWDLSASTLSAWLAGEREADRLSVQTSNYYLREAKSFCRWLVRDGRAPSNPFEHLGSLNANTDVRVERRPLSQDEFERFILAACTSKVKFRKLSGADRAMLYTLAAYTGLRASELASMAPENFDFTKMTVTVEAACSKHRRRDVLPLRADVAALLRKFMFRKKAGKKLWPGTWTEKGAKMVRMDLAAARQAWLEEVRDDARERKAREKSDYLQPENHAGRVFDFHSLRHQFISSLAASGVNPKTAQQLARHSTITLTLDRYSHVALQAMAAALESLPDLPGASRTAGEAAVLQATGTDNALARLDRALPQTLMLVDPLMTTDDKPLAVMGSGRDSTKTAEMTAHESTCEPVSSSSGGWDRTTDTRLMKSFGNPAKKHRSPCLLSILQK
jgi:integrase